MSEGRKKEARTEIGLDPFTAIRLLSNLVNLEPPGFRRVEIVAWSVATAREVGEHRTGIVRPLLTESADRDVVDHRSHEKTYST